MEKDSSAARRRILVWDLPTRVCHWLLAASFAGAYLTSDSESWRDLHVMCGLTAGALIAFRLAWGLAGTRYARFSGFAFAPTLVIRYLRTLIARKPEHYVGHNPAGSWAVLCLLLLVGAAVATGWMAFAQPDDSELRDALHALAADAALALVLVHVFAVVASSVLHRENLVGSMLSGRKLAPGGSSPEPLRAWVAAALLAFVLALWSGRIPVAGLDDARAQAGPQMNLHKSHNSDKES